MDRTRVQVPFSKKPKKKVFYCGHYGPFKAPISKSIDGNEIRFESLSTVFEWLKISITADVTYYIDVREE